MAAMLVAINFLVDNYICKINIKYNGNEGWFRKQERNSR
jgi:hypothetical protein